MIPRKHSKNGVNMKESTAYRHNTCVTLFQDDSSVSFLLSLISSPFQALPILLLPFPSSNGLLSSYLLSQASAHHPSLLLCLSKLPLKKPSSLSLNPLTWFHSSHMATQNCDTWQKIELHKSEKNEPQKMGVYTFILRSFHFFHPYFLFLFSYFFSFPLTTPSPSSTVTIATAGDMTPAPLSMPSSPLSHSFIFVLFYFICFDFNSKGLGGGINVKFRLIYFWWINMKFELFFCW